jgi:stage V sporulation protein G
MNITEVKLYPLQDSKTLALASITLDNEFVITGLKVVQGNNGIFVAMPSKKNTKENAEKKYYDIAFPITRDAREEIQNAVISKYDESLAPHEIYDKVLRKKRTHQLLM